MWLIATTITMFTTNVHLSADEYLVTILQTHLRQHDSYAPQCKVGDKEKELIREII
jgi:hypothetical protein